MSSIDPTRSQEPTPLSPIDRVHTTFEASIDAGLDEPSTFNSISSSTSAPSSSSQQQQQQQQSSSSPSNTTVSHSKTLPLPATSSLLGEEERPFAKPIRSFTNQGLQQQQQQEQQQQEQPRIIEQKVEAPAAMDGEQPMIAELPATPLMMSPEMQSHTSSKQALKPKEVKPEDESVLYNLPITPDAEAFEVAKKNINGGYFEPVFPADAAAAAATTTDAAKTVAPVVEGGKS